MKLLIPLLILCTSCTIVKHPTAGYYASLGGDTAGFNANASGFNFASNNNSPAFIAVIKQVRVMWQSYLFAKAIEFLGDKYYDAKGQEVDAATSVKLEELRNAKSIKEAELKLEELKIMEAAAA